MKKPDKGWFTGLGRDGDRDIEEQMQGLEQLLREVPGKTVLDAGCAEGLTSIELAKAGAAACHGLEIVESYIPIAQQLAADAGLPCTFEQANLNYYETDGRRFDVVLMAAVLHKLKNPSAACSMLAGVCDDLCVIRLPPTGPLIRDLRSEMVPHDILAVMASEGFVLESEDEGPRNEWQGYFRRRRAVAIDPEFTGVELLVNGALVEETPIPVQVDSDVYTKADILNTSEVDMSAVEHVAYDEDEVARVFSVPTVDVTTTEPVVLQPEASVEEPQQALLPEAGQERVKRKYTRRNG